MLKRTVLSAACLCMLAAATGVCAPTSKPSDQPASGKKKATYFHIRIKGVIGKDFTAHRMKSLLKQATEAKPDVVLLDINTPGGTIDDAEKIIDLIITHKDLHFVAFVRKALSAGAAITLACPEIYITDTATVGAATSYSVSSQGRIVELTGDIGEKFQSAWRAVCRKAAQRGRHSSLIAEAMVDRDFALTMRKENGKVVIERDGRGKTLAAKGRVLTLTGKEAVDCQLAKGLVTNLDGLRTSLNMQACYLVETAEKKAERQLGMLIRHKQLIAAYKKLIAVYKKEIAIKPDDAELYCGMGITYGKLKRYTDAIAAYKKAIAIKPDDFTAYKGMGDAYKALGQYAAAIAAYKKAVAIDPDDADVYYNMGEAYKHLKQYTEAIAAYRQFLRLEPMGVLADSAREAIRKLQRTQRN